MRSFFKQFVASLIIAVGLYFAFTHLGTIQNILQINPSNNAQVNLNDRVYLENKNSICSINKVGAKFDFFQFKNYGTNAINFLIPEHAKNEFFTYLEFHGDQAPKINDNWQADKNQLKWHGDIWHIEQIFDLEGYDLIRTVKIKNISQQAHKIGITNTIKRNISDKAEKELFISNTNFIERVPYKAQTMRKNHTGWIGMNDKYFAVANKAQNVDVNLYEDKVGTTYVNLVMGEQNIEAGQEILCSFKTYVGPKDTALLDSRGDGLNKVVSYGFWGFIVRPMSRIFKGLHYYIGSVGIVLILFTLIIKAITLPLSLSAQRSMQQMRDIQPAIAALKKQHSGSPQVLQLRMLELYKQHKLNPLSMFFQMIVQLLLFFPIYRLFTSLIDFKGAPFFGIVQDLSMPDPSSWTNLFGLAPWAPVSYLPNFGILPLIMALTFLFQPFDQNNKQMRYIFPIIMLFVGNSMPAAVVIYWIITNILTLIQNKIVTGKAVMA